VLLDVHPDFARGRFFGLPNGPNDTLLLIGRKMRVHTERFYTIGPALIGKRWPDF
jgi:hypothetical protein